MITLDQQFIGKAQALLDYYQDALVSDILINGTHSLFIEREGVLTQSQNPFHTSTDLLHFVERLLIPIGKRVDAQRPYLDGRLIDGGRFHIILPPIAVSGPYISIRKPSSVNRLSILDFGPQEITLWLTNAVKKANNLLICGSTGSGKTTLVGFLLDTVPLHERIALIEETMEIRSQHPHLIHLEARPASPEGFGEVTTRELVRNALRMRPDRIVLGECRGAEAFDLLQALNTGHSGSLGTLHANSCLDALKRLEALVLTAGVNVSQNVVREWVAGCIHTVIHLSREGSQRRINEIIEITGLEGSLYRYSPVYRSDSRPHQKIIGLHSRIFPNVV